MNAPSAEMIAVAAKHAFTGSLITSHAIAAIMLA
jgi:hypothetical protein